MADLIVDDGIYINGEIPSPLGNAPRFTTCTTLYQASSVSTGNKNLNYKTGTTRYKFSEFHTLAFGQYNSATGGYAWCFMSFPIFRDIGSFYVQQNIASQDRRFKMNYVSASVFNVSYVDNGGGIIVLGFN